uniref:Uncharacterized protein n=1 Tax=Parascaris equorum TaxID=6256 RepID=A0A914R5U3_PAREQ
MQLDLKIAGINRQLLSEAISRGREGIAYVLSLMEKAQKAPRVEFKDSVPITENISIPIFRRHILFRSGAYNVKLIEAETGVKVWLIYDSVHDILLSASSLPSYFPFIRNENPEVCAIFN